MTRRAAPMIVAATLATLAAPARAQDPIRAADPVKVPDATRTIEGGRDNPFLPQSTPGESRLIADRAALQQMVRDMMPELRSSLDRNYAHDRQEALDEIRRAAAANQSSQRSVNSPRIGPTMKLISCVNGRALYRDQTSNSTVFAKPGSEQQTPCDPP